jgi:two-component system sensor histidine kinase RegB
VITDVVARLPEEQRHRLTIDAPADGGLLRLPRAALEQIAHSLLRNAFEATPGPVGLALETRNGGLDLRIHDDGPGIAPDVLARVGEPFFSTKGPGQGLGLGVFIAKSLAEQLGGCLVIESSLGRGTTARVEIPASAA